MARALPHNIDAEIQVLGSAILWPDRFPEAAAELTAADFYVPKHRALFGVLSHLDAKGLPVDMIQISERLRADGQFEQVGGFEGINELCDAVDSSAGLGHYLRVVKELSLARRMAVALTELADLCHSGEPFDEIIGGVYRRVEEVSSAHKGGDKALLTLADMARMYEEHVGNLDANRFKTGFEALDAVIKGVSPGETLFITAYSGLFKSALLQNLLLGGCERNGLHHLFFSLEMPATRVFERTVQIGLERFTYNIESEFRHHDRAKRAETLLALAGKGADRLLVCEEPGLGLDKIEHYTRLSRAKHGKIGAVGIDYMGLMSAEGTRSEYERISAVAEGSKQLAKRLGVPVIVLTQISRQAATSGEVEMHSAKGSGAVEASADYMLVMSKDKTTGEIRLKVVKNRNGEAGAVFSAGINKPFLRFDSLTPLDDATEKAVTRGQGRSGKGKFGWDGGEDLPY